MSSNFRPRSSAGPLGAGVVLLVIGQMIYTSGAQQAARATFSNDGSTTMTVGAVILLAGLVALIAGIVSLARAVDYLARREHARSDSTSAPLAPVANVGDEAPPRPRPTGLSAKTREAAARGQAMIDEDR